MTKNKNIDSFNNSNNIYKSNNIKWKEVDLDNELLSEFTKYGVSMIEEIDDPTKISIYDINNHSQINNSNNIDLSISLTKKNKQKKRKSQSNDNHSIINSNIDSNINKSSIKKIKSSNLNNNQSEIILDPDEYWEEYYELKQKLIKWTEILDESIFKPNKNSNSNIQELKSPELVIHPTILKGLFNLNFLNPTPIQEACLVPAIRDRKDIIGSAETGSGKTLAYGIPIIANIMFSIQRRKEKFERRALKNEIESSLNITDIQENDILNEFKNMGFEIKTNINLNNNNKNINYKSDEDLQALIILPSRELAIQVRDHLRIVGKYTGLGIHAFVGGLSLEKQERLILKKNVQIAVGTPGRLFAFISNDSINEFNHKINITNNLISTNLSLDNLRFLVLDEADRLVEQGHYRELKYILQYIYKPNNNKIQTYIFSATLTLPNHLHPKFFKVNLKNQSKQSKDKNNSIISENSNRAIQSILQYVKLRENQIFIIDLSRFKNNLNNLNNNSQEIKYNHGIITLPKGLTISMIKCQNDEIEIRLLLYLIKFFSPQWQIKNNYKKEKICYSCPKNINNGKILLFVNSISYVYRLVPIISLALICKDIHEEKLPSIKKNKKCNKNCYNSSIQIIGIHGNLSQKQRIQAIELFKSSLSSILICTDVLARGLDLPEVDIVIHLQPPRNTSLMIHRSGRTARASKTGESILFCTPKDISIYSKYLKTLSLNIESIKVPSQFENITSSNFSHTKQRIELANEIENLEHHMLRKKKNNSWMINKAIEADLELSDNEEYNNIDIDYKKNIQHLFLKKNQLLEFIRNYNF